MTLLTAPIERRPGQFRIQSLMAAVVAAAGFCALATWNTYLAVLASFFVGNLLMLARIAGKGRGVIVAVMVAALVEVALIESWPILRGGLHAAGIYASRMPGFDKPGLLREWTLRPLSIVNHWLRLWTWESWSLARWPLVFGLMTWAVVKRSKGRLRGDAAAGALLWFTPWLIVMELGALAGVWLAQGSFKVIPEPSTIFVDFWNVPVTLGSSFWWVRMGPASLVVGVAFFRMVARWEWTRSLAGAVLFVPVAVIASILWSCLWLILKEYKLAP